MNEFNECRTLNRRRYVLQSPQRCTSADRQQNQVNTNYLQKEIQRTTSSNNNKKFIISRSRNDFRTNVEEEHRRIDFNGNSSRHDKSKINRLRNDEINDFYVKLLLERDVHLSDWNQNQAQAQILTVDRHRKNEFNFNSSPTENTKEALRRANVDQSRVPFIDQHKNESNEH